MRRFITALIVGTAFVLATAEGSAKAQEALTVTFTPTSAGGSYSPENIDVVWLMSGGTFVQTIGRWAGSRRARLIAWRAAAGTSDVDAVSGATQSGYGSLTASSNVTVGTTWDLSMVPDGTYTIRIESCDSNASSESDNHQGTFTFEKNGVASMQTTSGGGFNNVIINYTGRTAVVDAGVDLGPPGVDMGPAAVDMGPAPVDMGPAPVDMGTTPVDMGSTPIDDMGTSAIDAGSDPVDLGTAPTDGGGSVIDGGVRGTGVAPLTGTCSVVMGGSSATPATATLMLLGLAVLTLRRRRQR